MRRGSSKRWIVAGALIGPALGACNAILDNDPRSWDPSPGEHAGAPAGAGAPGGGGHAANDGASGKGGSTSGRGGTASSGRGGTATNEAGASGAVSAGGEVAAAGEGGEANASGAGGSDVVCECMPGTSQMNTEPCGACMTGMRTQTKTCQDDCTWGPFGEFGECTGVTAACSPGAPGSRSVACPCGGTKTQGRTCTDACTWGAWADTSSCDLACCSQVVYCNTPDDISPASRGTWCREKETACTNAEVDADCHADVTDVCGAIVPELYIEYL